MGTRLPMREAHSSQLPIVYTYSITSVVLPPCFVAGEYLAVLKTLVANRDPKNVHAAKSSEKCGSKPLTHTSPWNGLFWFMVAISRTAHMNNFRQFLIGIFLQFAERQFHAGTIVSGCGLAMATRLHGEPKSTLKPCPKWHCCHFLPNTSL